VCEQWCTEKGSHGNRNSMQFKPASVIKGLKDLSKYLNKFHGRKVFVLIDEFDSIVSKAVDTVAHKDELKNVIKVVMGVIGRVMKDNNANPAGIPSSNTSARLALLFCMAPACQPCWVTWNETFGEDTPRLKYILLIQFGRSGKVFL
jgi:hypothetical protein